MPWEQVASRHPPPRIHRRKLKTLCNITKTAVLSKGGLDIAPLAWFRIGIVRQAIVESD
jgi:hypothetical protein